MPDPRADQFRPLNLEWGTLVHFKRSRRRRTTLFAIILVVSMAVPFVRSTTASASGGGITSLASGGLCLDDTNSSTSAWTHMQLWTCTGGRSQQWQTLFPYDYVYWGDGSPPMMFRNVQSGLCLDVYEDSASSGAPAIQYPCNVNDHAQWFERVNNGGGYFGFQSNVGTMLDDLWAGRGNGNPVDFYQVNGTNAQIWYPGFDNGQQVALHDVNGHVHSVFVTGYNQNCASATIRLQFPNTFLDIGGWYWLTWCALLSPQPIKIFGYSDYNLSNEISYDTCLVPNWQTWTNWETCQMDGGNAKWPGENSI